MVRKNFPMGILMILILGMTLIGCDQEPPAADPYDLLQGRWENTNGEMLELSLRNFEWRYKLSSSVVPSPPPTAPSFALTEVTTGGTYTTTGTQLRLTPTHFYIEDDIDDGSGGTFISEGWYTKPQLKAKFDDYFSDTGAGSGQDFETVFGDLGDNFEEAFGEFFKPSLLPYSLNGDLLYLQGSVFSRQ